MADERSTSNTRLPGTGEVFADDLISGIRHQRVKISVGEDGTAVDLSKTDPMPADVVAQDVAGVYKNVNSVETDGKVSLYTVAGFSDTQTAHIDAQTDSTLIAFMLIDISDTTTWQHTNTATIILEYLIIEVDPAPNFLGEIKFGYLTNVDATNGDFNQIVDIDMARKSDLLVEVINFGSHGLHCSDNHHFGPKIANSTLFQTDVDLGGPDDPATLTYPSGAGDLVMIVDGDGTNFVDVSVTIGYETVA